jgi:hypothetical protein
MNESGYNKNKHKIDFRRLANVLLSYLETLWIWKENK